MVFISYSFKDEEAKSAAEEVCGYLERNGLRCWIAPRNIPPGKSYPTEIIKAIRSCTDFVLIVSKDINESENIKSEVHQTFNWEKNMIPFHIEDMDYSDEYIYYLERRQRINAYDNFQKGLRDLARELTPEATERVIPVVAESAAAAIPSAEQPLKAKAADRAEGGETVSQTQAAPVEKTPSQPKKKDGKDRNKVLLLLLALLLVVCAVGAFVFSQKSVEDGQTQPEEDRTAEQNTPLPEEGAETGETPEEDSGIHSYRFIKECCSWSEAFERAKAEGGYLVRINDPEEYSYILSQLNQMGNTENSRWWIGARRELSETDYYWVDENNAPIGTPIQQSDAWYADEWGESEPNLRYTYQNIQDKNSKPMLADEYCLMILCLNGVWEWDDVPDDYMKYAYYYADSTKIGYIVEVE